MNNSDYKLPQYIKIFKSRKALRDFKFFTTYDGMFVYFKKSYIIKDIKKFILTLLLWELSLSVLLIFMVHAILKYFSDKDRQHREFLEFLLGTISHKFGNFLSVQRLNLELVETDNPKPLERLKDAYTFMEKDFKGILKIIKDTEAKHSEKYSVRSAIYKAIELFKDKISGKKVDISILDAETMMYGSDFSNVIHELIENSVKYSHSYISITTIKRKKMLYITITNDIGSTKSGSGFGLSLVRYISSKNGWHFETKVENNKFRAALIIGL